MRFTSIDDIFEANDKVRELLLEVIAGVTDEEAAALPDGGGWSVGQVVEHVSIVNNGMAGICRRLIEKARAGGAGEAGELPVTGAGELATPGTRELPISKEFWANVRAMASRKAAAPERVLPTGGVSLDEAKARLQAAEDTFAELRSDLEAVDLSGPKFPHPYFGDLNAIEWLALKGFHERRHTEQIQRVLDQVRQ